ncbi:CGNR zinc finger domain-containing protein [Nesterenkonia sp. NBAIMH1]|uniref:CGNR zinc finger domain-containing protein n=1 Tax=Nesterenkonia sp. NBAIMH1 TaxID=2600320 RepID=UPI0011B5B055|nr:CGNR zinc finger domain-containing protein [Nesterenkonia sp. NBAIMH1]
MFNPEINRALSAAAELINTEAGLRSNHETSDTLTTVEDLKRYSGQQDPGLGWPTSTVDRPQLEKARALRTALRQIWHQAPVTGGRPMEQINDLLHGVGTRLEKVEGRGKTEPPFRQAPVPVSKKLGDIMTATMAAALTRLVVEEETARMRICKGEDCEAAIIDLTRNRSKLFCDFGNCANRAHVRAYRARQAAVRNGRRPAAATPQAPQEDLPREPKLNKPSSAEKAAAIEQPTSESAVAAKEFRDQMRTELMDARAKTGKKSKKKKKK